MGIFSSWIEPVSQPCFKIAFHKAGAIEQIQQPRSITALR